MSKKAEETPGQGMAQRIADELLKQGIEPDQIKKTMAAACALNEQAVYKWFDGRTKNPMATSIVLICDEFDLDVTWIIMGKYNKEELKKNSEEADSPKNEAEKSRPYDSSIEDLMREEGLEEGYTVPPGSVIERITKILLAANVPCEEVFAKVATVCALQHGAVAEWANGTSQPSPFDLAAISKYYGVDLLWLVTGTLSPHAANDAHMKIDGRTVNIEDFVNLGNVQRRPWRAASYA